MNTLLKVLWNVSYLFYLFTILNNEYYLKSKHEVMIVSKKYLKNVIYLLCKNLVWEVMLILLDNQIPFVLILVITVVEMLI